MRPAECCRLFTQSPTRCLAHSASHLQNSMKSSTALRWLRDWAIGLAITLVVLSPRLGAAATSRQLHDAMGVGINYGQHFESDPTNLNKAAISSTHLRNMWNKGFRHIRIPVQWGLRMEDSGGNVVAKSPFVDNVKLSVDRALAEGFIVILNTHHDKWAYREWANNTMLGTNMLPGTWHTTQYLFKEIWEDICRNFAGYSDKLIFEIVNEPENVTNAVINDIHAQILPLIRANGHPRRTVMLSVNDQNSMYETSGINVPAGADTNYLMLTVHNYGPWTFCGNNQAGTTFTEANYASMENAYIQATSKFGLTAGRNGIPINMGECGVAHRSFEAGERNADQEMDDVLRWYRACMFLAKKYQLTPTVWDDNGWFEVYNRDTNGWGTNSTEAEIVNCCLLLEREWQITHPASGMIISTAGHASTAGALIELNANENSPAQRYHFQPASWNNIAYYKVVNGYGQAIRVRGGTVTAGTLIEQGSSLENHARWKLESVGTGRYQFCNFSAPTLVFKPQSTAVAARFDLGSFDAASTQKQFDLLDIGPFNSTPPDAPTGVAATDGTYIDRVRVTWAEVEGATGYDVWRATTDNSASTTKLTTTTVADSPFDDLSAVAGTVYYYWVTASNGAGMSAFGISGNGFRGRPPTISAITARTINEDTNTGAVGFTISDPETTAGSLTLSGSSSNATLVPVTNIVFGGSGESRTITVTPAADQNGVCNITITVTDASGATATSAFTLTVTAVNDAPTMSTLAATTVLEDTATALIPFSVGDVETAASALTVSAASSNTTLVPVANITLGGTGANRTVSVMPAANRTGTATVTLTVTDAAGSIATRTLALTVTAVNDAPTISAITAQTIVEDSNTGNLAFTIGDIETAATSLTLSSLSSNTDLVPVANIVFGGSGANRTVRVTPLANQSGTATITVRVTDAAAAVSSITFLVTVTAVNDLPTIGTIAAQTLAEDGTSAALAVTVGDIETAATALTLAATSTNATLLPGSSMVFGGTGANRTLTIAPAANQSGTGNVTVTVTDSNGGQASRTFAVTVTAVNDAPTLSAIVARTIDEDTNTGDIAFTVNDLETAATSLVLSVASSNTALVPTANVVLGGIGSARTIRVTPLADQSGVTTVSITATDAASAATIMTFSVTVLAVNDLPTITGIAAQSINEDAATGAIAFTIGDVETPAASLAVSAASSNPALLPSSGIVFGGSGAGRTITATPAANQSGSASVTVTVTDAGGAIATATFAMTVNPVNDAPTISALSPQSLNDGESTSALAVTVGDLETSASLLTLNAASSNPAVVPVGSIIFGGSGASRTVRVSAAAAQSGAASVTITVRDAGNATASASFVVTVNARPTISAIADQVMDLGYALDPIAYTIADTEAPATSLAVSASSSNAALVPVPGLALSGTGAARSLTITPISGAVGTSIITVSVSDGAVASTAAFTFTVAASGSQSKWTATTAGGALPWQVGAHWEAGSAPQSGSAARLDFLSGATLNAGTITAQNDTAAPFILNALTLGGTGPATGNAALNLTGGGLQLAIRRGGFLPEVFLNANRGATGTFTVSLTAPLALAGPTTFRGEGTARFVIAGDVSGPGELIKEGSSSLILTGTNQQPGMSILGGTVQVGDNTSTGSLGAGPVSNAGTIVFHRNDTALTIPHPISGPGAIIVGVDAAPQNASRVTLTGANTFSGSITIRTGGLRITQASALGDLTGTKAVTIVKNGFLSTPRPQLLLDGSVAPIQIPATCQFSTSNDSATYPAIINEAGDNIIAGDVTLVSGGGGTRVWAAGGRLTLSGSIVAAYTGRLLILDGPADGAITGVMRDQNTTNTLAVEKAGAGTWTIAGTHTYSGGTSLRAGRLALDGRIAGSLNTSTGSILSGSGTAGGTVSVDGRHEPGPLQAAGIQRFENTLTYGAAARIGWDLVANSVTGTGTTHDQIQGSSIAITTGAAVDVILNRPGSTVSIAHTFWSQPRAWTIATAASVSGAIAIGNISADSTGASPSSYGAFSIQQSATTVELRWTPLSGYQLWSESHFGSLGDDSSITSATADPDSDGVSNAMEYAAGTDPLNAADTFRSTAARRSLHGFQIAIPGRAGRAYRLERALTLADPVWTVVGESGIVAADGEIWLTDANPPQQAAFYRVEILAP